MDPATSRAKAVSDLTTLSFLCRFGFSCDFCFKAPAPSKLPIMSVASPMMNPSKNVIGRDPAVSKMPITVRRAPTLPFKEGNFTSKVRQEARKSMNAGPTTSLYGKT